MGRKSTSGDGSHSHLSFSYKSAKRAAAIAVVGCVAAFAAVVATPAISAATVACDANSLVTALAAISGSGHSGTVTLTAGCTYTMTTTNNTFDGPNAFPDILGSVTIVGNGATITRSGSTEFRFFVVDDGGSLNISNLTLSNGSMPQGETHGGGAILNRDHLTVSGVAFQNNHSTSTMSTGGGAIDNHDKGVLTVDRSTFTGNVGLQGGGIEDEATLCHASAPLRCGSATVTNSTFTNNSTTQYGGGGFEGQLDGPSPALCVGSPPYLVECQQPGGAHDSLVSDTFSGNSSVTEGGGIATFGTMTITNSTITGNSTGAGGGGGVQNTGAVTITFSTIAGNATNGSLTGSNVHSFTDLTHQPGTTALSMSIVSGGNVANCGGTNAMTDNGYNIDSGTSCGFSGTGSMGSTNPDLLALASNGGPTQTMALNSGSPAIDAIPGNFAGCSGSTDQRGAPRPQNVKCDIGAFEVYTTPPSIPSGLTATPTKTPEVDLSWSASSSPLGVAGYDILRDGSPLATVSGITLTYADKAVSQTTTYTYTVDAFDAVGNKSAPSSPVSATTPDITPPSVPTGLAASPTKFEVDLTWAASTDNVGVTGYTIYRNGVALNTVSGSTLAYADTTSVQGTTYSYTVDAFDAAGNHSAQSAAVVVTTPQGWMSLGGILTSAPAVTSFNANRSDVFVKGTDNALYQRTYNGTSWSPWASLGGVLTSNPAAVASGANRIDAFVRGTDKALYQRTWNGTSWSDWASLGGVLTSSPAVSSWGANRLDVFVRGTDNALYHRSWDGTTWTPWESLGGVLTSDPSAVSWGVNHIDVFVRGTDKALYQRAFNGTAWTDWQSLGGVLTSAVGSASCASSHLDVFVIGSDGAIYRIGYSGAWGSWVSLGGTGTSTPGATCPAGTNGVWVYVRGTDMALWQQGMPGS